MFFFNIQHWWLTSAAGPQRVMTHTLNIHFSFSACTLLLYVTSNPLLLFFKYLLCLSSQLFYPILFFLNVILRLRFWFIVATTTTIITIITIITTITTMATPRPPRGSSTAVVLFFLIVFTGGSVNGRPHPPTSREKAEEEQWRWLRFCVSKVADGCRHVIFLTLLTNISFHYSFNRVSLSLHFQV